MNYPKLQESFQFSIAKLPKKPKNLILNSQLSMGRFLIAIITQETNDGQIFDSQNYTKNMRGIEQRRLIWLRKSSAIGRESSSAAGGERSRDEQRCRGREE